MYSPTIQEHGITKLEENVCPWWLDYLIGVISKQEVELQAREYFNFFLMYSFFVHALKSLKASYRKVIHSPYIFFLGFMVGHES